ncbi:acid ceramidase-like [Stylophora pistillata]|uniref:acid ceramidase-like n=1 Tax=Stylophora pistillata TaxID=50429 RepID=UPI000C046FD6|nr:acid ceramidase-like [Stylophora pistillata]
MEANYLVVLTFFLSFQLISPSKFSDQECVTGAYPPTESEIPWEVVNLDLPPEIRYNDLVGKKIKELQNVNNYLKNFTSFILNGKLYDFFDKDLAYLVFTLPSPYKEEIIGLSMAAGIPLGQMLFFNIFYEIMAFCTSIVAEDKSGTLFHARNMDFGIFMGWDEKNNTWTMTEILRTLAVNIDFQRNGQTVYKSVTYAGFVGVFTGIKPGVLTLTVNQRFSMDGGYVGIVEWILGNRKAKWSTFLPRDVLETATSFEQAKDMLANNELIAQVYYILGGAKSGEGVVITRSRTECLDQMSLDPENNKWFVLETNYDNWEPPLVIDDRRTPGKACMNKTGREAVSFKGIYNVLSTQPVLNKLTVYTTLMQVNSGKVESYIRNCPDPCFPW